MVDYEITEAIGNSFCRSFNIQIVCSKCSKCRSSDILRRPQKFGSSSTPFFLHYAVASKLGQAIGPLWDFCASISIVVEL